MQMATALMSLPDENRDREANICLRVPSVVTGLLGDPACVAFLLSLLPGQKGEGASAAAALLFTRRSLVRLIQSTQRGLRRLYFCSCEAFAPLLVQMD